MSVFTALSLESYYLQVVYAVLCHASGRLECCRPLIRLSHRAAIAALPANRRRDFGKKWLLRNVAAKDAYSEGYSRTLLLMLRCLKCFCGMNMPLADLIIEIVLYRHRNRRYIYPPELSRLLLNHLLSTLHTMPQDAQLVFVHLLAERCKKCDHGVCVIDDR